jgi:hypothetical protein
MSRENERNLKRVIKAGESSSSKHQKVPIYIVHHSHITHNDASFNFTFDRLISLMDSYLSSFVNALCGRSGLIAVKMSCSFAVKYGGLFD